jgi:L-alanine-DL-glutamate epimerase-like enolase superfamily enzyme
MKIEELEWIDYDSGRKRNGKPKLWHAVRVRADSGAWGWSQWTWGEAGRAEDRERADSLLKGRDPWPAEALRNLLWENGIRGPVPHLVDIALWDLRGRTESKPVHALLGTVRDRIRAYVSSPFNVGGGRPEAYAEEALDVRERGFHGYKIHPTHNDQWSPGEAAGDVETDIAIARTVREAIGDDPHFALMWDNFHTYSYDEAVRVGRVLQDLDFTWYESPLWDTDDYIPQYVRLREDLDIPLCVPESNDGDHTSRLKWLKAGACDINRIDFWCGGISSSWTVIEACREAGMPLDLHTGHYSHLQLIGATEEDTIPWFEHYATSPSVEFEGGRALVPGVPGMGLEPDWGYIESQRVG